MYILSQMMQELDMLVKVIIVFISPAVAPCIDGTFFILNAQKQCMQVFSYPPQDLSTI